MSIAPSQSPTPLGWPPLVKINVDQYHEMIRRGILREGSGTELLDGALVRIDRSARGGAIMSVGEEHRWSVEQLRDLNPSLKPLGCIIQSQQPVILGIDQEPEPDGAIVIGDNDRYRQRKPAAEDVLCVIEVADSSLEHDRTNKLRIYARAGVRQYIIVNLVDKQAEFYTQPNIDAGRFNHLETYRAGESIAIELNEARRFVIDVQRLLP